MIPCRIVSDAVAETDDAIPLRIFNPETNTTETAALVVEMTRNKTDTPTENVPIAFQLALRRSQGETEDKTQEVKQEMQTGSYGVAPVSFPLTVAMKLPVPKPIDDTLLMPPATSRKI